MFLADNSKQRFMSTGMLIIFSVIIFGMMYFLMIIRSRIWQKKLQAMLNDDLAVGDAVITTSGFYGIVIDITDDVIMSSTTKTAISRCAKQPSQRLKNRILQL